MNHYSVSGKLTLQEEADSIADLYGFLALSMRYPEQSFLTPAYLDTMEALLDSLDWQDEKTALEQWRTMESDLLTSLQVEYTRLFINAVPHVIAPPYGSVYLDGDASIQGKSTEKTRNFYREQGYDLADDSEPADHIRYELEFLAHLSRDNNFAAEEEFLKTLFRPWFRPFHDLVLEKARHPFYRVSVQLIDFLTKEEQEWQ